MKMGIGVATRFYKVFQKFGLEKLKKFHSLWSVLSVINYFLFFGKAFKKRFGVDVGYSLKGYIYISFSEGFTLNFVKNPGLPDLLALYGYIRKYVPKEGDIVVDGGAYHGFTTMYFSKLVGKSGKVIAFEPDKKNYECLKVNLALNKCENVIPINKGLREYSGEIQFYESGEMFSGVIGSIDFLQTGNISNIKVVNLIDELARLNVYHIDFVKMDIEGAEINVIQGMKEYLKDHNINFAIASYHMVPKKNYNTSIILEKVFKSIGYNVETSRPEHITTYASR